MREIKTKQFKLYIGYRPILKIFIGVIFITFPLKKDLLEF